MADTREGADSIRPKEREAMELWESLPEAERTYAEVAKRMRPEITEGRAGVYVRDALRLAGKEHLLPQRGRRGANGGNAANVVEEDPNPIHDLERMFAQIDERITALDAQLEEVTKEADEFDPAAAVTAETERLAKIVADAQSQLDAFTGDDAAQTNWATRKQGQLNDRKAEVAKTHEQRVGRLSQKKDGLDQIITLAKSNPELAEMFASNVDQSELDDAETLTNEPGGDEAETPETPAA